MNTQTKITAKDIQRRLISERYGRGIVVPNYVPLKWWECDVFELTKAGYSIEYEIKLSVSDFCADKWKQKTRYNPVEGGGTWVTKNKHELVASGLGPSRFYFVSPEGILRTDQVPQWAGLIHAYLDYDYLRLKEAKPAPRLHKNKVVESDKDHLLNRIQNRYIWTFLHGKLVVADPQDFPLLNQPDDKPQQQPALWSE